MDRARDDDAKLRKRERNRTDYLARKVSEDHVLLRLDKGGAASLDAAAKAAGLSRAAFARLYLAPLAEALAGRLADVDRARFARAQSLRSFVANALDIAIEAIEAHGDPSATQPSAAAEQFDDMFGVGDPREP